MRDDIAGLDHLPTGKLLRRFKPVFVAVLLGIAAGAGVLLPLGSRGDNTVALACGIGNTPTMEASGALALLLPVTTNVSANLPVGVFALNYLVGQPITFKEDLSNVIAAPPLDTVQLTWTFGDGTQGSGLSPTHTYTKPGTYNVYASIYSDGLQPFDSAQIHVVPNIPANPPVVKVTSSAKVIGPDGVISFSAAGSHSQDGSKLTYFWNFNDGHTGSGMEVKHEFPATSGNWFVGLTVTDGRGALTFTAIHFQTVTQLPTGAISASLTTVGTGGSVTFDASGSTPPSIPTGDQIVQYLWNFGDGTPQVTTTTPTVTHKFSRAGTFTVTVQAIDKQGAPGSKTIAITVVAVNGSSGLPSWLLYGGLGLIVAVLLGGGYLVYVNQRRRQELIRERQEALELARSRRIRSGVPPRGAYPPRGPRPGSGAPPRGSYPPRSSRPGSSAPQRGSMQPSPPRSRYRSPYDDQ
jgi:PKD repeat protein